MVGQWYEENTAEAGLSWCYMCGQEERDQGSALSWARGLVGGRENFQEAMSGDLRMAEYKRKKRLSLWAVSWLYQKLHVRPWKCLDI